MPLLIFSRGKFYLTSEKILQKFDKNYQSYFYDRTIINIILQRIKATDFLYTE